MVAAICKELELRQTFTPERFETVYFGGGTPSLLDVSQLEQILNRISQTIPITLDAEVTLETNPEDITEEKLNSWQALGINRLSIGIQTFNDQKLSFLNRKHTGREAQSAVLQAKAAGFSNISCDLIYAIPPYDLGHWEEDLNTVLRLEVPHISLYSLTIEEKTVFGNWKNKGLFQEVSENDNASSYETAVHLLKEDGFRHYEVSNFCKPGSISVHNSNYWSNKDYLGIGPGAHSFDGKKRYFNVSNNAKYMAAMSNGSTFYDFEELSESQHLNEYLLTGLRTSKGISLRYLLKKFNVDLLEKYGAFIDQLLVANLAKREGDRLSLSSKGMANADEITLKFFQDDQRLK